MCEATVQLCDMLVSTVDFTKLEPAQQVRLEFGLWNALGPTMTYMHNIKPDDK